MPTLCFFKHVEWISIWSFRKVSPLNCSKTNVYLPEVYLSKGNNYHYLACIVQDLPDGNVVKNPCQGRWCKRHEFDPCIGKIPWRRIWQPTPVFLPGKFLGQVFLPEGKALFIFSTLILIFVAMGSFFFFFFFCSENFAYITKVCPYPYYLSSI